MTDSCDLLCLDLPEAERVRGIVPDVETSDGVAAVLKSLADGTRLRLAIALGAGGEMCVCDLAWVIAGSPALVSHHVRLLRSAGLAASRRDGKLVMYRLTPLGTTLLASLPEIAASAEARA